MSNIIITNCVPGVRLYNVNLSVTDEYIQSSMGDYLALLDEQPTGNGTYTGTILAESSTLSAPDSEVEVDVALAPDETAELSESWVYNLDGKESESILLEGTVVNGEFDYYGKINGTTPLSLLTFTALKDGQSSRQIYLKHIPDSTGTSFTGDTQLEIVGSHFSAKPTNEIHLRWFDTTEGEEVFWDIANETMTQDIALSNVMMGTANSDGSLIVDICLLLETRAETAIKTRTNDNVIKLRTRKEA